MLSKRIYCPKATTKSNCRLVCGKQEFDLFILKFETKTDTFRNVELAYTRIVFYRKKPLYRNWMIPILANPGGETNLQKVKKKNNKKRKNQKQKRELYLRWVASVPLACLKKIKHTRVSLFLIFFMKRSGYEIHTNNIYLGTISKLTHTFRFFQIFQHQYFWSWELHFLFSCA